MRASPWSFVMVMQGQLSKTACIAHTPKATSSPPKSPSVTTVLSPKDTCPKHYATPRCFDHLLWHHHMKVLSWGHDPHLHAKPRICISFSQISVSRSHCRGIKFHEIPKSYLKKWKNNQWKTTLHRLYTWPPPLSY